jgi:hypothetical protein
LGEHGAVNPSAEFSLFRFGVKPTAGTLTLMEPRKVQKRRVARAKLYWSGGPEAIRTQVFSSLELAKRHHGQPVETEADIERTIEAARESLKAIQSAHAQPAD